MNAGTRGTTVDHNVVHGMTDDPDFLGYSGIPVEPGHCSFHPAPGVANMIQVSPPGRPSQTTFNESA